MPEKRTKAEVAAFRVQARADAAWLRSLAETAEAKLDSSVRRPTSQDERGTGRAQARADAAWLRDLAERAKAELERRNASET
jgi:hypothetical protein